MGSLSAIVMKPQSVDAERPHRWQDIADNPDDPRVVAWREERIRETAAAPLPRYEDVVVTYCSDRRVLDFGAANHSLATTNVAGDSTHDLVARHASAVVAVDVVVFQRPPHAKCTYVTANLLCEDEWRAARIEPVDVLFAGHVIEHLETPGELFDLAARTLRANGVLIVATPNPLWLPGLWARAAYRNDSVNPDHLALFGAGELTELGERHGFALTEWRYAGRADMAPAFRTPGRVRGRIIDAAYRVCRERDLAFAHNSIVAAFAHAR
jgi:2-polyprenyl-3-methyl-5-hydroxy-6-metoxy-1,4-benzoquinol methylase